MAEGRTCVWETRDERDTRIELEETGERGKRIGREVTGMGRTEAGRTERLEDGGMRNVV